MQVGCSKLGVIRPYRHYGLYHATQHLGALGVEVADEGDPVVLG